MGIITDTISGVGAWITGVIGFIADAIEGVLVVFYDGEGLTVAGALLLFGLAFSIVMLAFNFIRGLIRK